MPEERKFNLGYENKALFSVDAMGFVAMGVGAGSSLALRWPASAPTTTITTRHQLQVPKGFQQSPGGG